MGFGAGSALTVFPVAAMIPAQGYEATFFWFGLAQGVAVFLLGWFLAAPGAEFHAPRNAARAIVVSPRDYTPTEMVATPAFWVMYVMFVMMATGGLIATAQLTPIAKDYQIADLPVTLLGVTLPALTFALSLDRVLNGISRPFFGWVSDQIGRENTMFIAFVLEGVSILLMSWFGRNPVAFVLLTGVLYLAWGEIYSLFPATCGDTYGRRYAAANAGLLYTAKGTASLLVPLSSLIAASAAGWHAVFVVAAVMNIVAAGMALLVLKPMRVRMRTASQEPSAVGRQPSGAPVSRRPPLASDAAGQPSDG